MTEDEPSAGTEPALTLHDVFGGRRGVVDSAVPPVVFVAVNATRGLTAATWTAVAIGVVLLTIRLVRRDHVRHAVTGFIGVAIAAGFARGTGRAENFFLPGLLLNIAYAAAFVVSVLVGKPVVGIVLRQFTAKPPGWHDHPAVRRAYTEVTLLWAAGFMLRVVVQLPLYLAGRTGWLAVAKLALGWPVQLVCLAVTLPWVDRRTAHVPAPDG